MGITGGFASYGYSYKNFSFTAKINGIRKHFLTGCGIKTITGISRGLCHPPGASGFGFCQRQNTQFDVVRSQRAALWWELCFTAFFPTAENAPAVTTHHMLLHSRLSLLSPGRDGMSPLRIPTRLSQIQVPPAWKGSETGAGDKGEGWRNTLGQFQHQRLLPRASYQIFCHSRGGFLNTNSQLSIYEAVPK